MVMSLCYDVWRKEETGEEIRQGNLQKQGLISVGVVAYQTRASWEGLSVRRQASKATLRMTAETGIQTLIVCCIHFLQNRFDGRLSIMSHGVVV